MPNMPNQSGNLGKLEYPLARIVLAHSCFLNQVIGVGKFDEANK